MVKDPSIKTVMGISLIISHYLHVNYRFSIKDKVMVKASLADSVKQLTAIEDELIKLKSIEVSWWSWFAGSSPTHLRRKELEGMVVDLTRKISIYFSNISPNLVFFIAKFYNFFYRKRYVNKAITLRKAIFKTQ